MKQKPNNTELLTCAT